MHFCWLGSLEEIKAISERDGNEIVTLLFLVQKESVVQRLYHAIGFLLFNFRKAFERKYIATSRSYEYFHVPHSQTLKFPSSLLFLLGRLPPCLYKSLTQTGKFLLLVILSTEGNPGQLRGLAIQA